MKKFMKVAGVAVAFAAMGVSSASATTGPAMLTHRSPVGVASNIAAAAGSTGANLSSHVLTAASGATLSCTVVTFHPTTPTTNTARFLPTYNADGSVCAFSVSGTNLGSFSVDINCEWTFTFHHAIFNDSTGAGTDGTVDVPCQTTVTIPSIGCTIHVGAVSNKGAITSQNVNSAGANDTSASPWGSKIAASVTGLSYTTTTAAGGNCIIPATGTTATYAGSVYQKNVWGML